MTAKSNSSFVYFRLFSQLCGLIAAALGVVAIVGWLAEWRILTSIRADYIPMAPNTALSFIVLGISLYTLLTEKKRGLKLSRFGATVIFVLSLLRFTEFTANINLNVDRWIFQVPGEKLGLVPVGQMALPTTLNFLFASIALFLASSLKKRLFVDALTRGLGGLTTFIGLAFSLGYIYGAPLLYGATTIPMALNTAIAFFVLGLGLVINNVSHDIAGRKQAAETLRKVHDELEIRVAERTAELTKANEALRAEITEREQAQKALRESEDRYRDLVEHSQDLIYTHDLQGQFLSVNPAVAILFGHDRSAILNMNVRDILVPKVRDQFPSYLDTMRRDGVAKGLMLVQTAMGERRILEYNNTLRTEGVASPIVRGIGRDVTELKRAELALRQSEERYRTLVETSPDAITLFDLNLNIIMANRPALTLFGYESQEEVIGKSVLDYLVPEQLARVKEDIRKVLENGSIGTVEYTLLKKDGTLFPAELKASLILDKKKKPFAIICVSRDITERKQVEEAFRESEKRYRQVIENATEIIYSLDTKGNFTYSNPAGLRASGFSLEELRQYNYLDLILPEHRKRLKEIYIKQFYERVATTYAEFPFFSKSGEVVWFGQNASLVIEDGKIKGFHVIARDITERKRAEEALRSSEEKYRTILEEMEEGYFETDLGGNLTFINDAVCEHLGYAREELIGMNNRLYTDKENAKKALQAFNKTYRTGQPHRVSDYGIIRKDGTKVIIELSVSLRRDSEGNPIGFRGVSRNVTEHKKMEEALRQSEEKYRTILENMQEVYYEIDLAGNWIFLNEAFYEHLGYTKEELIGKKSRQYQDETTARELYQAFTRLYRTGEPIRAIEAKWISKDGAKRTYEMSASLMRNSEGEPIGFRGVSRDVTERKRAEEALQASEKRFRELFDEAPVGYHEIDKEGKITRVNRTELDMLGYTAEEMLGRYVYEFITEEISPQSVKRKLEGTLPIGATFERTYLRKDGTTISALLEETLIKDSEGRIIGIRTTIQNITERKRVEEEKATLQEQLRQSQKMEAIGQLAGGVAHDFNNILTVIKGYSQLSLAEMKEEDPFRENIEEIKKSADRAANLTRQLLAFSRRQMMEMEVLDLNDSLRNLDKMLRRVIGEDIELVTLLAEDLGRVNADPGQIEQIIMNLAVNARDAMPNGGKLTIETADVELDQAYARAHIAVKPGAYVMLSVSDSGMGMTQEVRDRVFEPFFTTKEKGKGTGLGLSTVYGIVKQSGGNIWVYSEPGKGTTFKIYLPRVDEPLEELKEKVVKEELPRGSETILIVEDEEDVLTLAGRILSRQGYKVLEVTNGGEALEVCRGEKEPIHLILTDVVMPQMSGRELIERCREVRQDFKAIYMSGYTDNTITHHGILERGLDYIQKPFSLEGLARKVREVLDK